MRGSTAGGGRPRIFICYRRKDTSAQAGRLFDDLARQFGRNRVFIDIDAIVPGSDFLEVIDEAIGRCDVLLALIGRVWLASTEERGGGLSDPKDVVRLELEAALRASVRVIPVLVDGATMPTPGELPASLAALTRRQAVEISHRRWRSDVGVLVRAIKAGGQPPGATRGWRRRTLGAGLAVGVGGLGAVALLAGDDVRSPMGRPSDTSAPSSVLFSDDFSTPNWPVDGYRRYEQGAYHVRPAAPGSVQFGAPIGPVNGDVRVEVNAQSVEGGTSDYGVFCRGGAPGDSGYHAALNSNGGSWRIERVDPGSSPSTRQMAPAEGHMPTARNFRWNSPNRVSLICTGKPGDEAVTLTLEINGEVVASVEDNQGLPEGTVGLFFSARGADVDVRYDDFLVRRVSS